MEKRPENFFHGLLAGGKVVPATTSAHDAYVAAGGGGRRQRSSEAGNADGGQLVGQRLNHAQFVMCLYVTCPHYTAPLIGTHLLSAFQPASRGATQLMVCAVGPRIRQPLAADGTDRLLTQP